MSTGKHFSVNIEECDKGKTATAFISTEKTPAGRPGRPRVKSPRKAVTISFSPETVKAAKLLAKAKGVSFSGYLSDLMEKDLAKPQNAERMRKYAELMKGE